MNIDDLRNMIQSVVRPEYRGRLIARGQARSMIWREGVLPQDSPTFASSLSHDLLTYGTSLLSLGLRLKEQGIENGDKAICHLAFERAGDAIESVISDGDPVQHHRSFYQLLSACSYHLAGLSARAYSTLSSEMVQTQLPLMQRAIGLLILRSLDDLEKQIVEWRLEGIAEDTNLVDKLQQWLDDNTEATQEENDDFAFSILDMALTDNFYGGIGMFLSALETGNDDFVDQSLNVLRSGLEESSSFNMVPQWWCHRLAIHIIQDLWNESYHTMLPEDPPLDNNENWATLRNLLIASLYRREISQIELWPSQLQGVKRALSNNDNLVISMPTSAGKTRIAEICILRCLSEAKRVVYITPLRALSAQMENNLNGLFGPLGKKVSTLYGSMISTGLQGQIFKSSDIVVATPEKLDFSLRSEPSILDDVGLIILDEGHMIGLGEREVRYEVLVQRLLRRPDANNRRIVCLSAVFPDGKALDHFVSWIGQDDKTEPVKSKWRPTRVRFGEVAWQGNCARLDINVDEEKSFVPRFFESKKPTKTTRRKSFPSDHKELVLATAWRLIEENHSVLIYCPKRKSVESLSKAIVDLEGRGLIDSTLDENDARISRALIIGQEWLGENHPVLQCLKLGVAVHHGRLPAPFRKELEGLLRGGVLRITVSSPTLAQGLNLTATSIVMYEIRQYRGNGWELIDASDFRNIIGRVGRAYVDVEGLVLFPMLDKHNRRRNQWRKLISLTSGHNIVSGMVQLVIALLKTLMSIMEYSDRDELMEYILNNQNFWADSIEQENDTASIQNSIKEYKSHLAILDTAILSLAGDSEFDADQISGLIDSVLHSSLWKKNISVMEESEQKLLKETLSSRSRFVWNNTNRAQRTGYFLAGVGYATGQQLESIYPAARDLLITANRAIDGGLKEQAIDSVIAFSDIIFQIEPFVPEVLPSNWKDVLTIWLNGNPIRNAGGDESTDVIHFVEDGITHKLPWSIGAIQALMSSIDSITADDNVSNTANFDLVIHSIESGTLSVEAAMLMQTGFPSRRAAIKVVSDTQAEFDTLQGMRKWLASDKIQQFSHDQNWPTDDSHQLWNEFIHRSIATDQEVWDTRMGTMEAIWDDYIENPDPGTPVRIYFDEDRSVIMSSDYKILGKVQDPFTNKPKGVFKEITVGEKSTFLHYRYRGPNDV